VSNVNSCEENTDFGETFVVLPQLDAVTHNHVGKEHGLLARCVWRDVLRVIVGLETLRLDRCVVGRTRYLG
jgi:hypothetical protein